MPAIAKRRSLSESSDQHGRALKPLLSALVLASAVAAPVFAEELSTFKGHLLYSEEVVEHDDDFNVFRQSFEACISASY